MGHTVTYVYDKQNRKVKEIDALGYETTFAYNAFNQVIKTTYPDGTSIQSKYDAAQRLIEKVDQLGYSEKYTYDEYDNLIQSVDKSGNTTRYVYDRFNNRIEEIKPNAIVTKYRYDRRNHLVEEIKPNAAHTVYSYNALDQIVTTEYANGLIETNQYNRYGDLLKITTNANASVKAEYTYDSMGRVLSSTDKNGKVTTYLYDRFNNVIEMSLEGQYTVSSVYSDDNQCVSVTSAEGNITETTYNSLGQRIKTNEAGKVTEYFYDAKGRLIEERDRLGSIMYGYDSMSRQRTAVDRMGNKTEVVYGSRGEVIKRIDGMGHEENYSYDINLNQVSSKDANGNETRYEFDANNFVVAYQDAYGNVVRYKNDSNGQAIEMSRQDAVVKTMTYDKMGQLIQVKEDNAVKESYIYDLLGQLIKTTIAGQQTDYTYNEASLLVSKRTSDDTFLYDYDGYGHLTSASSKDSKMLMSYDTFGNLLSVTDSYQRTVAYRYDHHNQIKSLTYPDGRVVHYTYDEYQRLIEVNDGIDRMMYTYDSNSNIIEESVNGIVTTHTYTMNNQRVSSSTLQDQKLISVLNYVYDGVGNITQETRILDGQLYQKEYTYDALNQVVSLKETDASTVKETQNSYDHQGNKQKSTTTINGVTHVEQTIANGENQVLRVESEDGVKYSYTYDRYGNIKTKQYSTGLAETYTFNGSNQLVLIEDNYGRRVEYTYDAMGNKQSRQEETPYEYLILKDSEDHRERTTADFKQIIESAKDAYLQSSQNRNACTMSSAGNDKRIVNETYTNTINTAYPRVLQVHNNERVDETYVYGAGRIKREQGTQSTFMITNTKNDVLVEVNNQGMHVYDYGLTGKQRNSQKTSYGYSSEYHDGSLQYLRARYYDTDTGVFISRDTQSGSLTNTLSQNRYIYTENNPVNWIDPSGNIKLRADDPNLNDKPNWSVAKEVDAAVAKIGPFDQNVTESSSNFTSALERIANFLPTSVKKTVDAVNATLKQVLPQVIQKSQQQKLTDAIASATVTMRKLGSSEVEIEAKRIELIQKYCEVYHLNMSDVVASKQYQEQLQKSYKQTNIKKLSGGGIKKNSLAEWTFADEYRKNNQETMNAIVNGIVTGGKIVANAAVDVVTGYVKSGGSVFYLLQTGDFAGAGKQLLDGIVQTASGASVLSITAGLVVLAVGTGGAVLPAESAALSLAGGLFTAGVYTGATQGIGGMIQSMIGHFTNDEVYKNFGDNNMFSGLIKMSVAGVGLLLVSGLKNSATPVKETGNTKLTPEEAANKVINGDRTGTALSKDDLYHKSPSYLSEEQLSKGQTYDSISAQGEHRALLQVTGSVNDKEGIFEYLINSVGEIIHQRFIPGGVMNGIPNQ